MYLFLVVFVAINETSLVYPVSKATRGDWDPEFEFEEITFNSKDGTKLVGWYLPYPGATENALLCHGNGENVAQAAMHYGLKFQTTLNANIFLFDYRGYGKSQGEPFEQGVLEDAQAAMEWLCAKANCEPNQIIVVGHSIGGGPAVHLASTQGAKAMFLQRTFASLVEPAARVCWFMPVDYIMRNRYPSAERISNCDVPLHQSHGDHDTLVPIGSGRKLFEASPAKLKKFFTNLGGTHWGRLPLRYWDEVRQFIADVNELPQHRNTDTVEVDQPTEAFE